MIEKLEPYIEKIWSHISKKNDKISANELIDKISTKEALMSGVFDKSITDERLIELVKAIVPELEKPTVSDVLTIYYGVLTSKNDPYIAIRFQVVNGSVQAIPYMPYEKFEKWVETIYDSLEEKEKEKVQKIVGSFYTAYDFWKAIKVVREERG